MSSDLPWLLGQGGCGCYLAEGRSCPQVITLQAGVGPGGDGSHHLLDLRGRPWAALVCFGDLTHTQQPRQKGGYCLSVFRLMVLTFICALSSVCLDHS